MKIDEYIKQVKSMKLKPSKYGNVKTNGYDSKKESKRADELKMMQRAGMISNLVEQVPYELIPAQWSNTKPRERIERACKYVADFVYTRNGETVVEDCKGKKTETYRIKKKLMLHVHGIRIKES